MQIQWDDMKREMNTVRKMNKQFLKSRNKIKAHIGDSKGENLASRKLSVDSKASAKKWNKITLAHVGSVD